uniref:Uncharacterized protein n=1 Tax=Tetranychus urticae TaxID=32264 RepID=T1KQW7_TETUR
MSFYVNASVKPHIRARSRLTTTVELFEEDIDNDVLPAAPMVVVLDPTANQPERRLIVSLPDVEYDYKSVVGSCYIEPLLQKIIDYG